MLSDAKDLSELMVDLAYASLYFGDPDMAEEVHDLEERMSELVQDMRAICILAVRNPREADSMSSVLQVISAIERIANDAVDITRIVTHKLGIPAELVADLAQAEEVSHRVLIRDGSHMAHRPLHSLELPVATGMRVTAVRRDREWITDIHGDLLLVPGDALFLHGPPGGIVRLRELAAAAPWVPPRAIDVPGSELGRAVDLMVEMKNISEAAVGLAFATLVLRDRGLAAEVRHLEDRLDEMHQQLELWVLRAASSNLDESQLRGVLHLAQAAEDLGDQAQQMVWLIEKDEEVHPVLSLALGDSDEVVVRMPVADNSVADGASLAELELNVEPGYHVLAIRRGGQYVYRPTGLTRLAAGNDIIARGPDEGREMFASRLGWTLEYDSETGEYDLTQRAGRSVSS